MREIKSAGEIAAVISITRELLLSIRSQRDFDMKEYRRRIELLEFRISDMLANNRTILKNKVE